MTVKCDAAKFRNLVNPYTGKPVEVKMLIRQQGSPLFFAPDTYSTSDFFPTAREAIDMWDRVDGVGGTKQRDSMKCAYTGAALHIEEVPGVGFHLVGGFNPKALTSDDSLVYHMTMRDGKTDLPPLKQPARVTSVPETFEHTPGEGDEGVERTEEALKVAEGVVDQFKDSVGMKKERTFVSMGKGKKGGKR